MKSRSILILAVAALAACAGAFAGVMPADPVIGLSALTNPGDGFGDMSSLGLLGFGGLVVNRANLTILNQAFNAAFKGGVGMVQPMWNKVAMRVPSVTGEEKYGWLGSTTRFREWLGDRVV